MGIDQSNTIEQHETISESFCLVQVEITTLLHQRTSNKFGLILLDFRWQYMIHILIKCNTLIIFAIGKIYLNSLIFIPQRALELKRVPNSFRKQSLFHHLF